MKVLELCCCAHGRPAGLASRPASRSYARHKLTYPAAGCPEGTWSPSSRPVLRLERPDSPALRLDTTSPKTLRGRPMVVLLRPALQKRRRLSVWATAALTSCLLLLAPRLLALLGGAGGGGFPIEQQEKLEALLRGKDELILEKEGELQEKKEQLLELESKVRKMEKRLQQAADSGGGVGGDGQRGLEALRKERDALWSQLQQDLVSDSHAMRSYLRAEAPQLRAAWQARLAKQAQRGILMSAGGQRLLINGFVTLHVLRHHLCCSLPVAVMYWGDSPHDNVDNATKAFFKEHISDLEFIDSSKLPYPSYHRPLLPPTSKPWYNGYKIKVFSLYAAPFQEVLYLDSDAMPLLDPAFLFEEEQYRQHGNLYWPDSFTWEAWTYHPGKLYQLFGLDNPWPNSNSPVRQCEPGEFLLNRSMWWEVLEWILFLNTHDSVVYTLNYMDKDTPRLAFALAGNASSFQQVTRYVSFIMSNKKHKGLLYEHPSNGTILFNHRTPLKFDLDAAPPPSTHVTATLSTDLALPIIYWSDGAFKDQIHEQVVPLVSCNYSLWDWPASQQMCAPAYNPDKRGQGQILPLFEFPKDSHLAAAETAAAIGHGLIQEFLKKQL